MINYTSKFFVGAALCGVFSQSVLADTYSLHVDTNSRVGIGTNIPTQKLHVWGEDGTTNLLVEETAPVVAGRPLFKIANNGPVKFRFDNTASGDIWAFNAANGGQLRIAHAGTNATPGTEFVVFSNGNVTIGGVLTESSDVNAKQDIEAVDRQTVLAKVMELPISEWSYKDDPTNRHIGPMAQDFYQSFGLGGTDKGIASIDTGGVALAAIQGVKREKDRQLAEKDAQIANLQAQLNQQEDRMMQLEMVVAELLQKQSPELQVGSAN